jgi:GNAT superfamily N-acetyltransferase
VTGPERRFGGGWAIRPAGYDDPVARELIADVQKEYVVRYGGPDATPVEPADFTPPLGLFLVGLLDIDGIAGRPVACGGWRARDAEEPYVADGDAEVKRMYVEQPFRGRGIARAMLAELERTAAAAGRRRMILETGLAQPEAIALYVSAGYRPIAKFGHYRDFPSCRCFGKAL